MAILYLFTHMTLKWSCYTSQCKYTYLGSPVGSLA